MWVPAWCWVVLEILVQGPVWLVRVGCRGSGVYSDSGFGGSGGFRCVVRNGKGI